MTDYMAAALQAADFIESQRLEGRAKWRRSEEGKSSDYSLYHGACGVILLLLELHDAGQDPTALAEATAFRNGTLQGAYLMIAARALGLDCGAMSGFNNAVVDEAFFPDGRFKTNFLCNIGYGDESKIFGRSPRLDFDVACSFA